MKSEGHTIWLELIKDFVGHRRSIRIMFSCIERISTYREKEERKGTGKSLRKIMGRDSSCKYV